MPMALPALTSRQPSRDWKFSRYMGSPLFTLFQTAPNRGMVFMVKDNYWKVNGFPGENFRNIQ